jgi:hypothetical protein
MVAGPLAVQPINLPIHDLADIERAIASLAEQPNGGVLFPPDVTIFSLRAQVSALLAHYRVPAISIYSALTAERLVPSLGKAMRRREFITLFGAAAAAWPLAARGQQTATPMIGLLAPASATQAEISNAVRQGLKESGFVEGQNVIIQPAFAEGQFDRLPGLAADLVRRHVTVITALGVAAAVAAKRETGFVAWPNTPIRCAEGNISRSNSTLFPARNNLDEIASPHIRSQAQETALYRFERGL